MFKRTYVRSAKHKSNTKLTTLKFSDLETLRKTFPKRFVDTTYCAYHSLVKKEEKKYLCH